MKPASPAGKFEINRNNNPVVISVMGYCQDIFVWQCAHLPLKNIKLATGKSSYHFNFLAQLKHFDWPKIIDCPGIQTQNDNIEKTADYCAKDKNKKLIIILV